MALTDEQLDDVKAKMEAGKALPAIIRENYPDEKPRLVRQQMVQKFTAPVLQEIVKNHVLPNRFINQLEVVVGRSVGIAVQGENVTAEKLDAAIAILQDGIVSLQARKTELQG